MTSYYSFAAQTRHYFEREHIGLPEGAVSSPADWRGRDMRDQADQWLVLLSKAEVEEINQAVVHLMAQGVALQDVRAEHFLLPTLADKIALWRQQIGCGRGFVVVRGLPVAAWGEEKSAYAYWGLGHHLGTPGAQNPQGELLGHVIDYAEEDSKPNVRRYRTSGNIDFHCDAADAVGLLCLNRAQSGGQSRIVSSVAIFNALISTHPELSRRLFAPFLLDRRDEQPEGQPGYSEIQACCWGSDGVLRTFYHSEYFRSVERLPGINIDPEAGQVLDFYDGLGQDPEFYLDMWLEPGDMQFISNHTILHARTGYVDPPPPAKPRHLLRLWLSLPAAG